MLAVRKDGTRALAIARELGGFDFVSELIEKGAIITGDELRCVLYSNRWEKQCSDDCDENKAIFASSLKTAAVVMTTGRTSDNLLELFFDLRIA